MVGYTTMKTTRGMKWILMLFLAVGVLTSSCTAQNKTPMNTPIQKSEEEWKAALTPEQFYILRQSGTERAFTGKYWNYKDDGSYACAGCGTVIFSSDTKFDSHCGWPSFTAPLQEEKVIEVLDKSHGMIRTEIRCATCGGHLGHVFNDGPLPTGLRYCINSGALEFSEADSGK
jgi:peptide-methionine (R)-S-oxide reductase